MLPTDADLRTLRDHAAAADAAGLLHPAQLDVLHRHGWLRMLAPRAAGGAELALPDAVRLEEAVAAADGSCGWTVTLCAGAGWFAGLLPQELARSLVQAPGFCVAGSGARTGFADRAVQGGVPGWRLSGRWLHATGAPWATHFTCNALLRDEDGEPLPGADGQPRVQAFIVPAAQVAAGPDWRGMGLRATASHGYALEGAWVPEDHGFAIEPRADAGPLYRFAFRPLAYATLAANVAGMARAFAEEAERLLPRRVHAVTRQPFDAAAAVRAQALLAADWRVLLDALDAGWARVAGGELLPADSGDAIARASLGVVATARAVVQGLVPACGLEAADTGSALNRIWRDFMTGSQHALLAG